MPNPAEHAPGSDSLEPTSSLIIEPSVSIIPAVDPPSIPPAFSPLRRPRRRTILSLLSLGLLTSSTARRSTPPPAFSQVPGLYFDGKFAYPTGYHPYYLHRIIQCANALVNMPYKYGGGHASLVDTGYDCSGSLSYVLCGSGFLRRPMASGEFGHFGQPGTGLYLTIYVRPGVHVFMTVCGLRFDTGDGDGPRWRNTPRSYEGFQARRIPGL
jgi:hypothetical protein